jgi:TolA-binding protein
MNKKMFILFFIGFISIASLGLSDIFITYESGDCVVDVRGNGKWTEAAIDMKLNNSSVVKAGPEGEMELDVNGETIFVASGSTVRLSDLQMKMEEKKKVGWLGKISRLAKDKSSDKAASTSTALAGVRGAESTEKEIYWFKDEEGMDPEYIFSSGIALFREGRYSKAIPLFSSIVDREETSAYRDEIAYYLGVSLFNNLQYTEADSYLSESINDKSSYYYEPALIHYSLTNYFLKNYGEAIEGFNLYTKDFANGDMEPYALLMLGESYKELGKKDDARKYFTEIEQKYSDSDVYGDALNELANL